MPSAKNPERIINSPANKGGTRFSANQITDSKIASVNSAIKKTGGFILACILVWLTLELLFAAGHIGEDTVVKPDPLLGYTHLENQNLTYRQEGFSRSSTNSFGFREREFNINKAPGCTRICVLGDSLTVGMEVPPEKTYSRLLEKHLNELGKGKFEVLNCAISGYGTGQEYLVYRQKVEQLNPDYVILAYNMGDAEDNCFQRPGMNPPRPNFKFENGNLVVGLEEVSKWFATCDARFYSSLDWLRRKSRVLAVLNKLNLDLTNSDPLYQKISKLLSPPISAVWNKFLSSLPPYPEYKIKQEECSFDLGLKDRSSRPFELTSKKIELANLGQASLELRAGMKVLESEIDVSLALISSLAKDCRKNNSKLIVVSGPALINSMFYYRELQAIKQASASNAFKYVAASKYFPPRKPMQESPYFFGLHFTRAGHQLMCNALLDCFEEELKNKN